VPAASGPPATRPDAAALVSPTATTATTPPPRPLELPDAAALVARPNEARGTAESAEQPAAQLPQQVRPAAPVVHKRPPTRRLEPGDLICPDCGEGNPETRKFCSRCGTSLETAQVVKRKWWQKLIRRGPKKRKAGDRPSARKTRKSFPKKMLGIFFGGVSRIIGVILIVGGLLYGLVPGVRNTINDEFGAVKDKINSWIHPKRTHVLPSDVFVSSSLRGHGSPALKDNAQNTYWAAQLPRGNTHITITFGFANKFDLKNLVIWNGVGDSKDRDYNSTARPDHVFLTFPGTSIPGCPKQFADLPADSSKLDVSSCNANGVDEISIRIDDYYPSSGAKIAALAAVEFLKS
jgi:hypothetical protein